MENIIGKRGESARRQADCCRVEGGASRSARGCRIRTGFSAASCSLAQRGVCRPRPSLTKALAGFLFDDDSAMVRIDK